MFVKFVITKPPFTLNKFKNQMLGPPRLSTTNQSHHPLTVHIHLKSIKENKDGHPQTTIIRPNKKKIFSLNIYQEFRSFLNSLFQPASEN